MAEVFLLFPVMTAHGVGAETIDTNLDRSPDRSIVECRRTEAQVETIDDDDPYCGASLALAVRRQWLAGPRRPLGFRVAITAVSAVFA